MLINVFNPLLAFPGSFIPLPYSLNNLFTFSHDTQKRELVDAGTIADHEIKNDEIVYMCFMKDTGGWEEPSADSLVGLPDQAPESGPA